MRRTVLISAMLLMVLAGMSQFCQPSASPGEPQPPVSRSAPEAPASQTAPPKSPSGMPPHGDPFAIVFEGLAIILLAAAVGRFGARKLNLPPVLGELAMGIVIGAIFYQLGGPLVTIIRHTNLVTELGQEVLAENRGWHDALREKLAATDFPQETKEQLSSVLLSREVSQYYLLARSIQLFSAIGIAVLLFMVGLEVSIKELKEKGGAAAGVALVGVSATFFLTYLASWLLLSPRGSPAIPLFLATAFCASSIGITARIFKDLNRLGMAEAKTVLGAAVLDDILGLMVLAVMSGIAASGAVQPRALLWIIIKTALFLGGVVLFGIRYVRRNIALLGRLDRSRIKLLYPFGLLMLLSWLADKIGLATIIGAFAAGVIIKEEYFPEAEPGNSEQTVASIMAPLEGLFAPIFFVLMGCQVDVTALADAKVLLLSLALAAVAVIGKMASALAVRGGMSRLIVGIGMLPRVEVPLIVANMGLSLGVLNNQLFSVIIIVVLLTVLITPPLLQWALLRPAR